MAFVKLVPPPARLRITWVRGRDSTMFALMNKILIANEFFRLKCSGFGDFIPFCWTLRDNPAGGQRWSGQSGVSRDGSFTDVYLTGPEILSTPGISEIFAFSKIQEFRKTRR
jgi:hypothetical protein